MAAIFGATASKKARVFQAGRASATIAGVPAILLGVTVQVQRQLSPIPTLTDGVVWSAQPVQGSLSAQSIIVAPESRQLLEKITDDTVCDPLAITVRMDDKACQHGGLTISIKDGYCSAVGFAMSGAQGYIGSDFTIQFTLCEIEFAS